MVVDRRRPSPRAAQLDGVFWYVRDGHLLGGETPLKEKVV